VRSNPTCSSLEEKGRESRARSMFRRGHFWRLGLFPRLRNTASSAMRCRGPSRPDAADRPHRDRRVGPRRSHHRCANCSAAHQCRLQARSIRAGGCYSGQCRHRLLYASHIHLSVAAVRSAGGRRSMTTDGKPARGAGVLPNHATPTSLAFRAEAGPTARISAASMASAAPARGWSTVRANGFVHQTYAIACGGAESPSEGFGRYR